MVGTSRGGQQSIYDFTFKKSRPENKILSAITDYIVEDILPFSTIEKPGLKKIVETLSPKSNIPGRAVVVECLEVSFDLGFSLLLLHKIQTKLKLL